MATPQRIIKAISEPYLLTSDDVQAFRENGYIHLAGVLPDDVLEYYEPIISKITQEHDPAAGVALEDKDLYGKAFIQLGNLWQPVAACGGLWRAVAACGAGVVSPKERLLQSQTAVSEAWRPVGCRLEGWDRLD